MLYLSKPPQPNRRCGGLLIEPIFPHGVEFAMKPTEKNAKELSEARRKNAAAAHAARYVELDRLTGQTAAERIKELNQKKDNGE